MEAVEEALLGDFDHWLNVSGKTTGSLEEHLNIFMKEKYATTVATENIFETIKTMNSPPPSNKKESTEKESTADVGAILQNLVACEEKGGQGDESSRKKRASEGMVRPKSNF